MIDKEPTLAELATHGTIYYESSNKPRCGRKAGTGAGAGASDDSDTSSSVGEAGGSKTKWQGSQASIRGKLNIVCATPDWSKCKHGEEEKYKKENVQFRRYRNVEPCDEARFDFRSRKKTNG